MRARGSVQVVGLCLTMLGAIIAGAQTATPVAPPGAGGGASGEAAAILGAARQALGGEQRISSLKTLVLTGRTRRLQGENLVPIEFEIAIELPDKYVRTDEIPARESGPASRGFNGDALVVRGEAPAGGGRRGGGSGPPGGARPPAGPAPDPQGRPGRGGGPNGPSVSPTTAVKQDFARLTLGLLATSFPSFPLTFGLAGRAEAPEGSADVLDVSGPGGFRARLFVDSTSHRPLMLSWTTPPELVPVVAGQPPPATLAPGAVTFEAPMPPAASAPPEELKRFEQAALAARERALASARPTEHRMYYADYRDAGGGFTFPFRIRRAVGATTVEETTVDRVRVNGKIDPRKFEVRK